MLFKKSLVFPFALIEIKIKFMFGANILTFQATHMDIESSEQIFNTAGLQQLCKNQKITAEGQPQSRCCSFLGVVTDYSNWVSGFQKIFIIDQTNQKQPVQIFIRSNFTQDFVTKARIGDIAYFPYFKVAYYQGQLLALRSEEIQESKCVIIPLNREQNMSEKKKQELGSSKDKQLKNRVEALRKFSLHYFSTKRIDLGIKKQNFEQNPEHEDKKVVKVTNNNIILRVILSEIYKKSYYIKMTDQKSIFLMKFDRKVQPGVYLLRAYGKVKKGEHFPEIEATNNTNLIEIPSWMRSFKIQERLINTSEISEKQITKFNVSTTVLREDLSRISLQSIRQSDEHFRDYLVKCQIMQVKTPFEQVFRKLVKKKKGKLTYYEQFSWDHPEGELIIFVHLYISDPTLDNQIFSVYLYSFDGKGNQFIPGLKMQMVQEMLVKNPTLLKRQYNEFINMILQKTNYTKQPLQLIISPLSNRNGTAYRIVDTVLSFD